MHHKTKTHQSLERALEIILHFRKHNSETGALELSQKFGLHKSTVSRILNVLKKHGFLRQNPENKKYSLGPSIADLNASLLRSLNFDLAQIARPYMEELRNIAGETTVLELATPSFAVLAIVCEGLGPIRIKGSVGDHHYYHTSAGAKSILAFLNPGQQQVILSQELIAVTPHSKTNRNDLEKELDVIRHQGFAFDQQENNLGIQAFGAPVFNHKAEPVAAVVIAGAAHNVTWEKRDYFVSLIQEAVTKISEQLHSLKYLQPDAFQ